MAMSDVLERFDDMLVEARRNFFVVLVQFNGRRIASESFVEAAYKRTNCPTLLSVVVDVEATNHPFLSRK